MSTPTARELVAQRKSTELATQSDNSVARYIDAVAPAGIAGRLIKFKGGIHCTADDGMPIDEHIEFAALCDQTLVGWLKFNEEGEAPERIQGLLYDGFRMPVRSELGDVDETKWPEGLDGRRSDPWLHQISIVLQRLDTGELFTFSTTTSTGRRACGTLLRHYDRLRRDGALPIVVSHPANSNTATAESAWSRCQCSVLLARPAKTVWQSRHPSRRSTRNPVLSSTTWARS